MKFVAMMSYVANKWVCYVQNSFFELSEEHGTSVAPAGCLHDDVVFALCSEVEVARLSGFLNENALEIATLR